MTANELREKYIEFFKTKGHTEIPYAPLIPENDPSVLFTTAGMHPLKPFLMGEKHPSGKRLVDYQKCVRTGDIDEVGDKTHLTFFEMLGNWSLGDYFKNESIQWSWEFLIDDDWLGLDSENLAVSVFAGDENAPFDEEAYNNWIEVGLPKDRIAKLGREENWWPAGGKGTGPQGPDTEIFYWTGDGEAPKIFDPKNEAWVEIWNNVFMQFEKHEDGTLSILPSKNVDTGMGLERVIAVLQEKGSVYETELFSGILKVISDLAQVESDADMSSTASMRIIADHIRTAVMIIADGVEPSNKDQGYILRRLIRRAIRHARKLNIESKILIESIVEEVVDSLSKAYPYLIEKQPAIVQSIQSEAVKFENTIQKGLKRVQKLWDSQQEITGKDAFDLYQSFGFPLELTEEIANEYGQDVDCQAFEAEFIKHQEISRSGAGKRFAGGLVDDSIETTKLHTATHLLHQALRNVLGEHVEQKGSNITHDRLRFDFSYSQKMTDEEKEKVEHMVNEQIQSALPITCDILTLEEAKKSGAIGLFEEKYKHLDDKVKVYFVGDFSSEICGGPHVKNTSELGTFKIKKEEASSAGVRRIKAILI